MSCLLVARNQCEELRSTLTKRGQDQVCAERLEQLRLKEEVAAERRAEEAMYARLWEQDMLDKAAREEREAQEQRRRNLDTVDVLRQQMAALDAQKEEAKKLKEEEAQLLVCSYYIYPVPRNCFAVFFEYHRFVGT